MVFDVTQSLADQAHISRKDFATHIQQLLRCGMLAPDHSPGRFGGGGKYGIDSTVRYLRDILLEEKRIFSN